MCQMCAQRAGTVLRKLMVGYIVRNHFKLIEGDARGLSHVFGRCDMIKKTSAMKVDES